MNPPCNCAGCRTPDLPNTKRCVGCHYPKPLGWFCQNGYGRLKARCRECLRPQRSADRATRKARLKKARVRRVTLQDIQDIGTRQGWRCACGCGQSVRFEYHIDHRKALARGGEHRKENLQLMTPTCNLSKGARP